MERRDEVVNMLNCIIEPILSINTCKRCQGQKILYKDFLRKYEQRVKETGKRIAHRWTKQEAYDLRCYLCNGTGKKFEFDRVEDMI